LFGRKLRIVDDVLRPDFADGDLAIDGRRFVRTDLVAVEDERFVFWFFRFWEASAEPKFDVLDFVFLEELVQVVFWGVGAGFGEERRRKEERVEEECGEESK
jgi:hypothetical protein